jgi:hypothetical protein
MEINFGGKRALVTGAGKGIHLSYILTIILYAFIGILLLFLDS